MFQLSLFKDQMTDFIAIKKHTNVRWPDDIEQRLRVMLADNMTRSEIARELGVTRNSIYGKVHRMGLSKPRQAARRKAPEAPRVRARPWIDDGVHPWRRPQKPTTSRVRIIPKPVSGVSVADSERAGIAFLDLTRGQCRWPLYEGDAPRMFCGDPAESKSSYCQHHTARSFKPVTGMKGRIEARIKFLNNARRAAA